jgi:hypothetical protein
MEEFLRLTDELEQLKRLHQPIMDQYDRVSDQMDVLSEQLEAAYQEGYATRELLEEYDRIGQLWVIAVQQKHSILDPLLLERDKILEQL